jgi:hypothetical protein
MILPFTMASGFACPTVMELTRKALSGISGPAACSPRPSEILGAGFHPMGQEWLRVLLSKLKEHFLKTKAVISARSKSRHQNGSENVRELVHFF